MNVNTKLSLVEYSSVVEELVDGYFSISGQYQPEIGIANAMRVFYNMCTTDTAFDAEIPHDFIEVMLVDQLANNDEFLEAFNDCVSNCSTGYGFTFGNAFKDAQSIISERKRFSPVVAFIQAVADQVGMALNTLLSNSDDAQPHDVPEETEDVAGETPKRNDPE